MSVRILVIDDNPYDGELAARALQNLGVPPGPATVVCAADWDEAEPHLETEALDLVLLDFNLPGRNGLDVLRALRARPHPPVVMLTGQEDVATAVETLRAGAYDYVSKSADWGPVLCVAVERVLARVALEREVAAARARLAVHARELERKVEARTALVRAQAAQIEELYLHAEEAARLKAEIVSNTSHELRTPLNVILGYAELLEEHVAATPEASRMLHTVRAQATRLRELVDGLLALGRLKSGTEGVRPSRFTLRALVEELRADAETLNAGHGLALEWRVPPEPSEVRNDREKVRAIAYHLLSNAIKFTPEGRVEVALERTADGGLVLRVSDTGIGLPPEARAIVFDDFRQLDGSSTRRYEGLGLGLGIVKRYAALLGGAIRLESAPGCGTTVIVELPSAPAGPHDTAAR